MKKMLYILSAWILCGILGLGMTRYVLFEFQYHINGKIGKMITPYRSEIVFVAAGPVIFGPLVMVIIMEYKEMHSHCFGFYITPNLIFPNNHPNAKNMNPKLISATE